ncbi:hypothetical protein REPUB_Repub09cG0167000 [Reevesia pubescens]
MHFSNSLWWINPLSCVPSALDNSRRLNYAWCPPPCPIDAKDPLVVELLVISTALEIFNKTWKDVKDNITVALFVNIFRETNGMTDVLAKAGADRVVMFQAWW